MTHIDVPHSSAFTADAIADRLRTATSMADLLITTAHASPDQIALRSHETGLEWTYAETLNRIGAVAQTLHEQGIRRGQPVALMLRNRPEFHVVDAAVMMLGAVPFSIYNTSSPEQIAFVLEDSGAEVVVAESGFLTSLEAATEVSSVHRADPPDRPGVLLFTATWWQSCPPPRRTSTSPQPPISHPTTC